MVGVDTEVGAKVGLKIGEGMDVTGDSVVEGRTVAVEVAVSSWPPHAAKILSTAIIAMKTNRMHRFPKPPTYLSCLR